jgi:hypothetical protein
MTLMHNMDRLESTRLVLRRIALDDLSFFVRIHSIPEVRLGHAALSQTAVRVRSGRCLCGAVRFSVRVELLVVGTCHCADCGKATGAAFVFYADWPRSAFTSIGEVRAFKGRSFVPPADRTCSTCPKPAPKSGPGPSTTLPAICAPSVKAGQFAGNTGWHASRTPRNSQMIRLRVMRAMAYEPETGYSASAEILGCKLPRPVTAVGVARSVDR